LRQTQDSKILKALGRPIVAEAVLLGKTRGI
jgi:hypothetical protein